MEHIIFGGDVDDDGHGCHLAGGYRRVASSCALKSVHWQSFSLADSETEGKHSIAHNPTAYNQSWTILNPDEGM